MNFSKSKYCCFKQCPKMIWMQKYKSEECILSDATKALMEEGNIVGDLAMQIFGDYTEVTTYKDNKLDIPAMIEKTNELIASKENVICEASFSYNGLYCAVDILKKEEDGYSIYEVKSSSGNISKHKEYIYDVAYQKYILTKCGLNVVSTHLININNDYVFDGNLHLNKLFKTTRLDQLVEQEIDKVEQDLIDAKNILEQQTEPNIDLNIGCHAPHDCGFWEYCSKHLPRPSVFELYLTGFNKKLDFYKNKILSLEDLSKTGQNLGKIQSMQVAHATQDLPDQIDKVKIKEFLNTLSYPLYFLDFETMKTIIPQYIGTTPNQPIPFQYSLHYIEEENGEIKHKEFLAESGIDPRRAIAESLCANIPEDSCVLSYNKSFECSALRKLADAFPDLRNHLMNIENNVKDLLDPFRGGYYYNKAMGNSFSIKKVLPALFPNDPSLDYHQLEDIQNGTSAMTIFPKIKDMPEEEQIRTRNNLLKYCKLDTFAMVKVWQKLIDVSK